MPESKHLIDTAEYIIPVEGGVEKTPTNEQHTEPARRSSSRNRTSS